MTGEEITNQLEIWNQDNEGYNEIEYKYWDGHNYINERLCYVNELYKLITDLQTALENLSNSLVDNAEEPPK